MKMLDVLIKPLDVNLFTLSGSTADRNTVLLLLLVLFKAAKGKMSCRHGQVPS